MKSQRERNYIVGAKYNSEFFLSLSLSTQLKVLSANDPNLAFDPLINCSRFKRNSSVFFFYFLHFCLFFDSSSFSSPLIPSLSASIDVAPK